MKDVKNHKKVVQLEDEEAKEQGNRNLEIVTPSRKIHKLLISFDVYFQRLMKQSPGIFPHHKAPMRSYADSKGLKEATKDDFDRIFRMY